MIVHDRGRAQAQKALVEAAARYPQYRKQLEGLQVAEANKDMVRCCAHGAQRYEDVASNCCSHEAQRNTLAQRASCAAGGPAGGRPTCACVA
jgi:hypothetical protein